MPAGLTNAVKPQSSAGTSQPGTGVKQDLYYDTPKADLVLVSDDNVLFRVDAWVFAKERCAS